MAPDTLLPEMNGNISKILQKNIFLTLHRFVECDLLVLDEAVLPEVFLALLFLLGLVLGDKSLVAPSRKIKDCYLDISYSSMVLQVSLKR